MVNKNSFQNDISNIVSEINEKSITNEIKSVNRIYVELGFLKNLFIGTLSIMYKLDETSFNEFRNIINSDVFKKRTIEDPIDIFPFMNISRTNMYEFIKEPAKHERIFLMSPSMTTETYLSNKILEFKENKKILSEENNLFLTVNTYPLTLSNELSSAIAICYTNVFGVDVDIICKDYKSMTEEELLSHDIYYISNLVYFSNSIQELLNSLKFSNKYVSALKLIFDKPDDLNKYKLDNLFELTISALNFAMHFEYIDPPECLSE